ncbi:hypothetical protein NE237_023864 [Protea cynaroides]|uniref:Uncharacterized protein n=1 Tax=Protea cynaroides TaxID=273540 RepID=A0A9Q0HFW9_9MAGN|nr:hypothetical protein NE237_023864 [Protea cynaroides]
MKDNAEQVLQEGSSSSGLEKAAVSEDDRLPRGPVDGRLEGTPSQSRLEEDWTPIRVKKKRSGGSHGGLNHTMNPTHILTHQSYSLHKNQPLKQVSTPGKLVSTDSNFKNPSQNATFLFGATNSKSAGCVETALCPPNRFGCLNSEEDQSALAGPTSPPAVTAMQAPPGPSDPLAVPNEPLLSPGLTIPTNSAGHTPYPPRRPSLLKRGGLNRQSEPRSRLAFNPSAGSTRAQVEVPQSPLGPIAPPSSILASNKSLFDQMRAVVRQSHAGNVSHPIGPITNINCPSDCGEIMEKDRMIRGKDYHDQRGKKNGEDLELYGKNCSTNQCINEEEIMYNNQFIQSGDESEEGGQYGDPRKVISLRSTWEEIMDMEGP